MKLFDNYEEDGQLSLFSADYDDWDDDWVENSGEAGEALDGEPVEKPVEEIAQTVSGATDKKKQVPASKAKEKTEQATVTTAKNGTIGAAVDAYEKAVAGLEMTNAGPTIRVKYCATCGKLLFVREETAGFHSECNNCGIKYFQKL